jgi:hypothetical protein
VRSDNRLIDSVATDSDDGVGSPLVIVAGKKLASPFKLFLEHFVLHVNFYRPWLRTILNPRGPRNVHLVLYGGHSMGSI